jgi:hypothetical protein
MAALAVIKKRRFVTITRHKLHYCGNKKEKNRIPIESQKKYKIENVAGLV